MSENPFEPSQVHPPVQPPQQEAQFPTGDPLAQLKAPGIALVIVTSLGFVAVAINIVIRYSQGAFDLQGQNASYAIGSITGVLLMVVCHIIILLAGINMTKGKQYRNTRVGAILAVIPCCSPVVILGIPFGIWSLVLLMKPEVRSAFHS